MSGEIRIIVCGGRNYDDLSTMRMVLARYGRERRCTIIHGGAPGADTIAGEAAQNLGFPVEVWPADWRSEGKGAGPRRNQRMVDAGADVVLAFPGGRGTADCVRRAKAAGIYVRHVPAGFPREREA
jgi:hypothetical protein